MYTSISQRLKTLIDSKKTVFTLGDLHSFWSKENKRNVVMTARRMVRRELLLKLGKGYYALNKDYNRYELANTIISPSYVSLHSALLFWGVAFQKEETVYSIALLNYEKELDGTLYSYHAMKKELFFDMRGVIVKDYVSIASSERAILDSFYFGLLVNLDNQEAISRNELLSLSLLYPRSVQKEAMVLSRKL
jgi:predicted transcriptional regulator of viral defense system